MVTVVTMVGVLNRCMSSMKRSRQSWHEKTKKMVIEKKTFKQEEGLLDDEGEWEQTQFYAKSVTK